LAATVLDLVPVAANRPLLPIRITQKFNNILYLHNVTGAQRKAMSSLSVEKLKN